MFHRFSLLFGLVLMLLSTACGPAASSLAGAEAFSENAVATQVAATLNAAVPTGVAATLDAATASAAEANPTAMMATVMDGMSPEELATHIALMDVEPVGTPTPFFTPTPFPTFTPTPTQAEALSLPSAAPTCTNLIAFVKNLTINDNTAIKGGEGFAKLWRVKNAGTCNWTNAYALVFVTGEQLSGPASVPLAGEVAPGQTVDLRVDLVAPHDAGFFTGSWMLQDASGNRFGLIPDGSQPLSLTIEVKPHEMSGHSHH